MSITRNIFRTTLLIGFSFILLSCGKTKPEIHRSQAILSAHAISIDSEYSNVWDESQELGVFVLKAGSSEVLQGHENLRHLADLNTGIVNLVPAQDTIWFPEDGSTVDLIAYHPYKEQNATQGFVHDVDLSDQENPTPKMLISGKSEGHNSVMNTVRFTLRPKYSKLKINLKVEDATTKASENAEISLVNCPFKGTYDIIADRFNQFTETGSAKMIQRDKAINTFEALVLPHTTGSEANLSMILHSGDTKTVLLNDHIKEFKEGTQYDLDIMVTPDGIKAKLVGVSSFYITDRRNDNDDVIGEIGN